MTRREHLSISQDQMVQDCNNRLFELYTTQKKIERKRVQHANDQSIQLELDRMQTEVKKLQKTFRTLKEAAALI